MEWYRILIIVVGALGMALALVNWLLTGEDVPNGLVTLLSLIISAALGPDAISKLTSRLPGRKGDTKAEPIMELQEDQCSLT